MSLKYLISQVGVKYKVEYVCNIEKKAPKKDRTCNVMFIVKCEVHDLGLVFNNGLEIRHVDKDVFKYCSGEVIRKNDREKTSGIKPEVN